MVETAVLSTMVETAVLLTMLIWKWLVVKMKLNIYLILIMSFLYKNDLVIWLGFNYLFQDYHHHMIHLINSLSINISSHHLKRSIYSPLLMSFTKIIIGLWYSNKLRRDPFSQKDHQDLQ